MKPRLPNVRKLFIPDPGYTLFDVDLQGADAQVVAWEADDEDLKAAFRAGLDVHDKNATDMLGHAYTSLPGDTKHGPKARKRKEYKVGIHLTNYGGRQRTLARSLGWTVHEAEQFQKRWFSIHPGINRNWHRRVEAGLVADQCVRNAFGYRRKFFDRLDVVFPQALAWTPQSTVAIVTFKAAVKIQQTPALSWIEFLLQVHDSLVFQTPQEHEERVDEIRAALNVTVPYPDPLIIPWSIARSRKSWGEVEAVKLAA